MSYWRAVAGVFQRDYIGEPDSEESRIYLKRSSAKFLPPFRTSDSAGSSRGTLAYWWKIAHQ
jgi:hypothetical protein